MKGSGEEPNTLALGHCYYVYEQLSDGMDFRHKFPYDTEKKQNVCDKSGETKSLFYSDNNDVDSSSADDEEYEIICGIGPVYGRKKGREETKDP